MNKTLLILAVVALFAACKKDPAKAYKPVRIETNLATSGESYHIVITDIVSGKTITVLDTTVTGQFTYTYIPPAGAGSVKVAVDSNDTFADKPTVKVYDGDTLMPETSETDTAGVDEQVVFMFVVA